VTQNSVLEQARPKGVSWRSLSALLFSIFVVQPVLIYYNLISNLTFMISAWIAIMLWSELANLFGSKLTTQELFIVLVFQPVSVSYSLFFINILRNMYYSTCDTTYLLGIAQHIPEWWAPRGSALDEILRSKWVFLHPAWIMILSLFTSTIFLLLISDIGLGYFNYLLFSKVEKLEFPAARAQVATLSTLSQRSHFEIRMLFNAVLAGSLINLLSKFLPYLLGSLLYGGMISYTAFSPLLDLTDLLDNVLPGSSFTISGDAIWYVTGMLLPIPIALAQFLGAFSLYFIGTKLITSMNLWPPESAWSTGWGWSRLVERSNIYFYTSLTIGLCISALVMPILLNPKPFIRAFGMLRNIGKMGEEWISSRMVFVAFLLPSITVTLISWYLTGFEFPLFNLLAFIIGGSFFVTYLATASLGVTYVGFPTIPYIRELMLYLSGSPNKQIWFTPFTLSVGGQYVAQSLFQADYCSVKAQEFIKIYVILVVLSIFSGFLFTMLFWYAAPIPSSAYPATIISWPVDALTWGRMLTWMWSGYIFRVNWIMIGFMVGSVMYAISSLIFKVPYFLISFTTGIFAGVLWYIPPVGFTLSQLIGSIISNKIIGKKYGDAWRKATPMIVMGFTIGDGLMEILRAMAIMVVRSLWILPY
jgi:hypothetical protein